MVELNPDFNFGVVFKITDLNTGKFYIGGTTVKEKWENGYPGSGRKWRDWYDSHPDHKYKIEPLHFEYNSIDKLYELEFVEILKYSEIDENGKYKIVDPLCMNSKVAKQSYQVFCEECGGYSNIHKSTYSKYRPKGACEECGNSTNSHKTTCSKFHKKNIKSCSICGGKNGIHKKYCSKYKDVKRTREGVCEECGYKLQSNRHSKNCSKYKIPKPCRECGSKSRHKPWYLSTIKINLFN